MRTMLLSQSCSIHTFLWKNRETFIWNHYLLWLDRFNVQLKEAKVDLTDCGRSILCLYQMATDICWPERREACKQLATIWSQLINKSFKKMPMATWVKLDPICWVPSFRYMIVKRIQRSQAAIKRKQGSNSVLSSMKPMFLDQKDQEEWKFCFRWFPEMDRKCFGLIPK